MNRIRQGCCDFYRRLVRLLFGFVALWLFVSSLVFTSYLPFNEISWISSDNTVLLCLLFAALCLALLQYRKIPFLQKGQQGRPLRIARWGMILCAGILAIWWVSFARLLPLTDAKWTREASLALLQGSSYGFENGHYMSIYPHQSGLALFQYLLLSVFGQDNVICFQYINCFAYMVILWAMGEFSYLFGLKDRGCLAVTILGILFYPLMFYVTFVYGTLLGLALSMTGLLLAIRFCEKGGWHRAVFSALALSLAVMIKPNYEIFVVGVLLYLVYSGLMKQNKGVLLPIFLLLVGLMAATRLPIKIMEQLSGCTLNNGYPTSTWLVMGLTDGVESSPGWWSSYANDTYAQSGQNAVIQNQIALEDLKAILSGYLRNPFSFVRFLVLKNATQWCDPLFHGLWLNNVMMLCNETPMPQWAQEFLSTSNQYYLAQGLSVLQSLIYGGLVLWAWVPSPETRKDSEDLLAVILLGGFLFHCFWEAKGQYTMPYYVLVFPLAKLGYARLKLHSADSIRESCKPLSGKVRWLMPLLALLAALLMAYAMREPLKETLEMYKEIM